MKLSSPIFAFTLASTSLHAGIFLVTDHVNLALPGSTGSVMSIKLVPDSSREKASFAKPVKQKSSPQPETKSLMAWAKKPRPTLTHESRTEPEPRKETAKQTLNTARSSEINAVSRAQVISIVYAQLSNYFEYPRMAQLHNWQGQVVLIFRITSNGEIQNIRVNHSSGFEILDHAAISSLKKIGKLPQLASGIKTGMEIQLPVLYQLTEG